METVGNDAMVNKGIIDTIKPKQLRRPGRRTADTIPLTPELRRAIAEYHLSSAQPTRKETALKFGVSERTVGRCCDMFS